MGGEERLKRAREAGTQDAGRRAGRQAGRRALGKVRSTADSSIFRAGEKLGEPEPAIKGGDRKLETQYSI